MRLTPAVVVEPAGLVVHELGQQVQRLFGFGGTDGRGAPVKVVCDPIQVS